MDDTLLIILGNQLFDKKYISTTNTKNIFMAEDFGLCTEEKYHKQKIFFFLSAMRSFKDEMSALGYKVFYNKLNEKNKNKDFIGLLGEFLAKNKFKTLKLFEIEDKFFEKKIFDYLNQKILILKLSNLQCFFVLGINLINSLKIKKISEWLVFIN